MRALAVLLPAVGPESAFFGPLILKSMGDAAGKTRQAQRVMKLLAAAQAGPLTEDVTVDGLGDGAGDPGAGPGPGASTAPEGPMETLVVNEIHLRRAWVSSDRSTKEDWVEWLRNFSVELLKESPSPALRACYQLAQAQPRMARELFAAGFVSCWLQLTQSTQEQLVRSLEAALASPSIPPEIVTALLNLAEFMEHDEKALPLDFRTLGVLAEKCQAYAKALHYKELEFESTPDAAVEPLISINNQLHQPEAAIGMLEYARRELHMNLKDSWYEKLQRWDEALEAYARRMAGLAPGTPAYLEALLGRLRCLAALGEWDELARLCRDSWAMVEPYVRRDVAILGAYASWNIAKWDDMADYTDSIKVRSGQDAPATALFLSAVISAKQGNYAASLNLVERARDTLSTDLAALVGESYDRAYTDVVRVQQLAELEEAVDYLMAQVRRGRDGEQGW